MNMNTSTLKTWIYAQHHTSNGRPVTQDALDRWSDTGRQLAECADWTEMQLDRQTYNWWARVQPISGYSVRVAQTIVIEARAAGLDWPDELADDALQAEAEMSALVGVSRVRA